MISTYLDLVEDFLFDGPLYWQIHTDNSQDSILEVMVSANSEVGKKPQWQVRILGQTEWGTLNSKEQLLEAMSKKEGAQQCFEAELKGTLLLRALFLEDALYALRVRLGEESIREARNQQLGFQKALKKIFNKKNDDLYSNDSSYVESNMGNIAKLLPFRKNQEN